MKIKNIPEKFETSLMLSGEKYLQESEMDPIERSFLHGIIREIKPLKVLEVGVAAGGSSIIILNAIKDMENAELYSVDSKAKYFRDARKNTGYMVAECIPELCDRWKLYTGGGGVAEFIDAIGAGIDLVLLDAAHVLPGEVLDFLMIFPFMTKEGVVVLHDTSLYTMGRGTPTLDNACGLLFSSVVAEKIQPLPCVERNYFLPNIGAFQLNDDTAKYLCNIFFAMNFQWGYIPSAKYIDFCRDIFHRYYDNKDIAFFENIYSVNKQLVKKLLIESARRSFNNNIK